MTPFDYPAEPHRRRHGPAGYADPESFRPWLRDEFTFRCVYCLRRERWEPGRTAFEMDHLVPVARASDLAWGRHRPSRPLSDLPNRLDYHPAGHAW